MKHSLKYFGASAAVAASFLLPAAAGAEGYGKDARHADNSWRTSLVHEQLEKIKHLSGLHLDLNGFFADNHEENDDCWNNNDCDDCGNSWNDDDDDDNYADHHDKKWNDDDDDRNDHDRWKDDDDHGYAHGSGGSQHASVSNSSNTNVYSNINAESGNTSTIYQDGGNGQSNQSASVNADSNTNVYSNINATSGNSTTVMQY